jgi:glycosyltransferase involved in cell wall biosynthesis
VETAARRLRIVLLAHMVAAGFPDADAETVDGEERSLRSARRVIATSEWTRSELARRQVVPAEVVTMAGSLDVDPAYAQRLETLLVEAGLTERVTMAGVLTEDELDRAYRHTDLVVAPSRAESYGMAIADALRRGIPVIASSAGGIPQTVAGSAAALLVPPDESAPLADALRRWMLDPALRARLKAEAKRGRGRLPRWSETADRVSRTLGGVR